MAWLPRCSPRFFSASTSFVFVSLVLVTLTSHQIQYAVQSLEFGERGVTLATISRMRSQISAIDYQIGDAEFELDDLRFELRDDGLDSQEEADKQEELTAKEEALDGLKRKREAVFERFDEGDRMVIEDIISKREFLRGFENWLLRTVFRLRIAFSFVEMPPELLTQLLVLFMGALGGTVHLAKIFLDRFRGHGNAVTDGIRNASYYLFRPLLGAIVAFCVYVLVKAGVLVVSLPTGPDGTAQLNPFFLSFLGIISGMLAEDALGTIKRAGSAWFASSEAPYARRWAHDELAAIVISEDQRRQLASHLGVTTTLLDGWMNGDMAVPLPRATNPGGMVPAADAQPVHRHQAAASRQRRRRRRAGRRSAY